MQAWRTSLLAGTGILAGVLLFVAALASNAQAQPKSRQIETEAEFIRFNPDESTVTVKVIKAGKRMKGMEALKKGKEATFKVKPEGSVLTRTTVKLQDGTAGKFDDLQPGRKLRIFWVQDKANEAARFARSISVFVPAEELGEELE